jgi:hypothetical protein
MEELMTPVLFGLVFGLGVLIALSIGRKKGPPDS